MSKATRKLSVTSRDVMQEVGNLLDMEGAKDLLPHYLDDMEKEKVGWPVWFTVRQELAERVYHQGEGFARILLEVIQTAELDFRRVTFLSQGIENALERRAKAKGNGSF